MLHEFLSADREELIQRCRSTVARRTTPRPTEAELEHGVPRFLDQLITTLRIEERSAQRVGDAEPVASRTIAGANDHKTLRPPSEMDATAALHGDELLRSGFSVDQVVHDYGDLCQSITALAMESNAKVTTDEFRTLNRCLDDATAGAVAAYNRQHDRKTLDAGNERLGVFAHEMRNAINVASLAIGAIKRGNVGLNGATGVVLDRSMTTLRRLVDRTLAEVRLAAEVPVRRERIPLAAFIEELDVAAAMEANARALELTVDVPDGDLGIDGDSHLLASAASNLLGNAFKFTRSPGRVALRAYASSGRIFIEIEDECGGIAPEKIEGLFRPFEQHGADRSGLGLGLAISRRGVEACGGRLHARSIEGVGCIFTMDLVQSAA